MKCVGMGQADRQQKSFKSNGAAMLFFRSKRRCSESRESEGVLPDGDVHGKETVAFGEK